MAVSMEIVRKSKKDTIESAPLFRHDSTSIPEDLWNVLENHLKDYKNMTEISRQYLTILKGLESFKDMDSAIYWYIWKLLLYLEQYQGIVECRQYTLYKTRIAKSKMRGGDFIVSVPGLQEDRPSVRIRDIIEIMPSDGKSLQSASGEIRWVGKDYINFSIEDTTFKNQFSPKQAYDVFFRWDDWESRSLNYAIDTVKKHSLMRMVFPVGGNKGVAKHDEITWINKSIETNPEQQQAILNILSKSSQPDPYILFGPPGTGKTSTIIETICQINKKNSSTKILICTPSNSAADEIVLKLLKYSIPDSAIYRMYSASRNVDDIPDSIKYCANLVENDKIYLSKDVFITKKIVVVTLASSIRVYHYDLKENHFSYLFIDEAGQATEPQMLIPLLVMCGHKPSLNGKPHGQIVIAGDPEQLGPVCQSKIAEPLLGTSMLERLMNWGPYKRRAGRYDPNYVTKLVQNYRCHPAILSVPNDLFYDNELITCGGEHTQRAVNWFHLPRKGFPVIFHAVNGQESREAYSPSVCNLSEVKVIMNYVEKLLGNKLGGKNVMEEEIGIVTPYKLQKNKITQALEKRNFNKISVGTVEIFQGQERDIIIISTVRSVLYKSPGGKVHIGFLSNPKRFNVAITRAKALLIVIGNPVILQQDYHWYEFIKYCKINDACCGFKFELDKNLSHSQIRQLLGKKHVAKAKFNQNGSLPIVEDPESRRGYEAPEEDTGVRRRRLPIGYDEKKARKRSVSSDDTMRDVADIDYWPEGAHSSCDSADDYDSEESLDDEDDDDKGDDGEKSSSAANRNNQLRFDNNNVFTKLHRRMEELEISSSSSTKNC